MKKQIFTFLLVLTGLIANAQIGYQLVAVDRETGEPKANQNVNVEITITDNDGTEIFSIKEPRKTDNVGMVEMTLGSSNTFDNVDWSKLPLWISAKVDDTSLGRTEILSVPVAEYAKHTGELTIDILCSKTHYSSYQDSPIKFNRNGTGTLGGREDPYEFRYTIVGNAVICVLTNTSGCLNGVYNSESGVLSFGGYW